MKKIVLICVVALLAVGCSDEETPGIEYNGADNYIITLDVIKDGVTWPAYIADKEVVVTVPPGQDLSNSAARVLLSENAVISPDPAEETDWNKEHTFTVTAYNGEPRVYSYRVEYSEHAKSGDVWLTTQQEVDNFIHTDITFIEGNLTIGTEDGTGVIENLTGLSHLEQVSGMLSIHSSYTGNNLSGLEGVTSLGAIKIGDILTSSAIPALTTIDLPALSSVSGTVFLSLSSLDTLALDELTTIGGSLYIRSGALAECSMPLLEMVAGEVSIEEIGVELLDFPALKTIGGNLLLSSLNGVQVCRFPELESIRNLTIEGCELLENIEFDGIERIKNLQLTDMSSLINLHFPSLVTIEEDAHISGSTNTSLTELDGLPELQVIGGELYIIYFRQLNGLTGLKSLKQVGSMRLESLEGWRDELNLSAIDFNGGLLSFNNKIPSIRGGDLFNGSITVNNVGRSGIPEFNGFKRLNGTLTISKFNSGDHSLILSDMEYIENLLIDGCSYLKHMETPRLKEIGDTLLINHGRMYADFPALEKVGKKLDMNHANIRNLTGVNFPRLKEVGYNSLSGENCLDLLLSGYDIEFPELQLVHGSIAFSTGVAAYTTLNSLACPQLREINGDLTISAGHDNSTLTALNFNKLQKTTGSIIINRLAGVTDFSTFYGVIPNLNSADQWLVTGCGSNPTWEEMMEQLNK
ncbi:MAG: DUF5018 domain-containing protein [Tannerellaceae bacterium]|nr:DUF5018 domain-containing protein [Tannerellaceae bacterium]